MNITPTVKKIEAVQSSRQPVHEDLIKDKANIVVEARENMCNLSLVVGGLAAAGIVLLGSTVRQVQSLVLLGVGIFFVLLIYVLSYLFSAGRRATKKVQAKKRMSLDPIDHLGIILREYQAGKTTEIEFESKAQPHIETLREYQENSHDPQYIDKDFSVSNEDIFFVILLAEGLVSIALGVLLPYFK